MKLAFTTFAILKEPYGHPVVQEFDDRTPDVFAEAEQSPGFVARAAEYSGSELSNFERDWGEWGQFAVPRFYTFGRTVADDQRASTLSVWEDLASVFAFVYGKLHVEALRKRREWFLQGDWPTYACWWIEDGVVPQWSEATANLERLHDEGPTPEVFDFTRPFDADGRPVSPSQVRIDAKAVGTTVAAAAGGSGR